MEKLKLTSFVCSTTVFLGSTSRPSLEVEGRGRLINWSSIKSKDKIRSPMETGSGASWIEVCFGAGVLDCEGSEDSFDDPWKVVVSLLEELGMDTKVFWLTSWVFSWLSISMSTNNRELSWMGSSFTLCTLLLLVSFAWYDLW